MKHRWMQLRPVQGAKKTTEVREQTYQDQHANQIQINNTREGMKREREEKMAGGREREEGRRRKEEEGRKEVEVRPLLPKAATTLSSTLDDTSLRGVLLCTLRYCSGPPTEYSGFCIEYIFPLDIPLMRSHLNSV